MSRQDERDARRLAGLLVELRDRLDKVERRRIGVVTKVNAATSVDPMTVDISFDDDGVGSEDVPDVLRSANYSTPAVGHRVVVTQWPPGEDDESSTYIVDYRIDDATA